LAERGVDARIYGSMGQFYVVVMQNNKATWILDAYPIGAGEFFNEIMGIIDKRGTRVRPREMILFNDASSPEDESKVAEIYMRGKEADPSILKGPGELAREMIESVLGEEGAAAKELPLDAVESHLSAEIGVYSGIARGITAEDINAANGDITRRGGLLREINSSNGLGSKRKYMIIVGDENIIPSPLDRKSHSAFKGLMESVGGFLDYMDFRQLQIITLRDALELDDFLNMHEDATQQNTFLYYDMNVMTSQQAAGRKDINGMTFMSASLSVPQDRKGFISLGGLAAFAIGAMAVANNIYFEQDVLYTLQAMLETVEPAPELLETRVEEIRKEWERAGSNLAYLTSGLLSIKIFPIDINSDLADYYRREKDIIRAL
jgi:hypothetical protein